MTPIEITTLVLLMAFVVIAILHQALFAPAYKIARTGKVMTRWQRAMVWCYQWCILPAMLCFYAAVVLLVVVCIRGLITVYGHHH